MKCSWKTVTLMLSSLVILAAACGDEEDSLLNSCKNQCKLESQASDCPQDGMQEYRQMCDALCEAVVPTLNDDCRDKFQKLNDCKKNLEYACAEGGAIPLATDLEACSAQSEAYAPCVVVD